MDSDPNIHTAAIHWCMNVVHCDAGVEDMGNTNDITATMPVNPNVYVFPELEGDQL